VHLCPYAREDERRKKIYDHCQTDCDIPAGVKAVPCVCRHCQRQDESSTIDNSSPTNWHLAPLWFRSRCPLAKPIPPPCAATARRRSRPRSTFVADNLITRGAVAQQRPDRLSGEPQPAAAWIDILKTYACADAAAVRVTASGRQNVLTLIRWSREEVVTVDFIPFGIVCIMALVVVADSRSYSRSYPRPPRKRDDPFRRFARLEAPSDPGLCSTSGHGGGSACGGS